MPVTCASALLRKIKTRKESYSAAYIAACTDEFKKALCNAIMYTFPSIINIFRCLIPYPSLRCFYIFLDLLLYSGRHLEQVKSYVQGVYLHVTNNTCKRYSWTLSTKIKNNSVFIVDVYEGGPLIM